MYHYGAQYLHHTDNDLYVWARDADLLTGTAESDEFGPIIMNGVDTPAEIDQLVWQLFDSDDESIGELVRQYPHDTHSMGATLALCSACANI